MLIYIVAVVKIGNCSPLNFRVFDSFPTAGQVQEYFGNQIKFPANLPDILKQTENDLLGAKADNYVGNCLDGKHLFEIHQQELVKV